jgi:hypothetical protein
LKLKASIDVHIGHWGDPDVDGRIILRWIFRKVEEVGGLNGVGSG